MVQKSGVINTSKLNIGGLSTNMNSRNIFDTITTGIYTYKTLSNIRNSHFYNATTAISIRDFVSGSFLTNNTTQTNTLTGIKVINTVPNSALGIRININNNHLYNPSFGIQLLNVVSAATLIFSWLKLNLLTV